MDSLLQLERNYVHFLQGVKKKLKVINLEI